MESRHKIVIGNANRLSELGDKSVDLVVTSPPYPMIEMWDAVLSKQDDQVAEALKRPDPDLAFELMHKQLDAAWIEVKRVMKPGGFVCVNIGDATRSFAGEFKLFSNHSRILTGMLSLGFSNLPNIIWRKQTNAPNKFMGSGMLPAGAYVTLEHEYILIFRNGQKRAFQTEGEKVERAKSAFFWEERNVWFSDVWDFKGISQRLNHGGPRERSGSFPFELPYRLINMFSVKGDMILDPFLGLGTTMFAAMASGRNSAGYEIDGNFLDLIRSIVQPEIQTRLNDVIRQRFVDHQRAVEERRGKSGPDAFKHTNKHYGFPVMTTQETDLLLNYISDVTWISANELTVQYHEDPVLTYSPHPDMFPPNT